MLYFNTMQERPTSLRDYLVYLQATGRVSFTRAEALEATRLSESGFLKAAARLQRERMLLKPRQGFYVAVPPQFLLWGAPPPSWYIDELMRHEGRCYYVGLLKAAELHGATQQAVMDFQVLTDRQLPKIRAGRSYIVFFYRKRIEPVLFAVERRKTDTGSMAVSSVELTCLDLVRYVHAAGGFDAVATVLADLADRIEGHKLAVIAEHFERAVVQRLGYLLDYLGYSATAEPVHRRLFAKATAPWVKLDPARRRDQVAFADGGPTETNARWHVIVQRTPEVDE
jgi:predicted transcriptional regulator of viral defense system